MTNTTDAERYVEAMEAFEADHPSLENDDGETWFTVAESIGDVNYDATDKRFPSLGQAGVVFEDGSWALHYEGDRFEPWTTNRA